MNGKSLLLSFAIALPLFQGCVLKQQMEQNPPGAHSTVECWMLIIICLAKPQHGDILDLCIFFPIKYFISLLFLCCPRRQSSLLTLEKSTVRTVGLRQMNLSKLFPFFFNRFVVLFCYRHWMEELCAFTAPSSALTLLLVVSSYYY